MHHIQDSIYCRLCYTSHGALDGTREISDGSTMRDRSDDPSHHERTLCHGVSVGDQWLIRPMMCDRFEIGCHQDSNFHVSACLTPIQNELSV